MALTYQMVLKISTAKLLMKNAYKALSLRWHPDKNPKDQEKANRIIRLLNDIKEMI